MVEPKVILQKRNRNLEIAGKVFHVVTYFFGIVMEGNESYVFKTGNKVFMA